MLQLHLYTTWHWFGEQRDWNYCHDSRFVYLILLFPLFAQMPFVVVIEGCVRQTLGSFINDALCLPLLQLLIHDTEQTPSYFVLSILGRPYKNDPKSP